VAGVLETVTVRGGEQVAVAAGECRRCGSRVWFDPSSRAVAEISAREAMTRSRVAELRKTMAADTAGTG
jgi:hypothetical protein